MGFLDMSDDQLARYIARKYDSVDGHEQRFSTEERRDYNTALTELKRRVGPDMAEHMIDNA